MNQLITATQNTMSSLDLFIIVNQSRENEGENKTRLNQFNSRIVDELDGEDYQKMVVQNPNGTESIEFLLTVDQCMLIAMRESKAVRKSVLAKVRELESQQAPKIPQTYAAALIEAGRLALEVERQAEQLAIAAPKVAFVDRYVASTGNKGFRQVAKLLKAKENSFRAFLSVNKILYQLGGEWVPYQNHIDAGRFEMSTGTANEHAYNTARFTPKGVEWIAGLWAVHNLKQCESVK